MKPFNVTKDHTKKFQQKNFYVKLVLIHDKK